MSSHNNLREQFGDASPDVKLKVLRYEMIPPIDVVRGVAAVLKKIDPKDGLPDNFGYFIDSLVQAGDDLHSILDALTDSRGDA
jgi:hypothetical protein